MAQLSPGVTDLLGKLGVSAELLNRQIGQLQNAPINTLKDLRVAYAKANAEGNRFTQSVSDSRINLPPFLYNPPPRESFGQLQGSVRLTYHRAREARHPSSRMAIMRLANERTARAAKLQRLINTDLAVRSRFEKIAGGIVVLDGRMDGTITMRTKEAAAAQSASSSYSSGVSSSALTGAATDGVGQNSMFFPPGIPLDNIYDMLNGLDQAILQQAASLRPGAGAFAPLGYGDLLTLDPSTNNSTNGSGNVDPNALLLANGIDPVDPNNTQQGGSMYSSGDSSDSGALTAADPATTKTAGTSNESVDLGAARLEQFMQKRDQMYDLVRQIFTAYNQNAQKAIDNMKG
jgi:hypothetical protein